MCDHVLAKTFLSLGNGGSYPSLPYKWCLLSSWKYEDPCVSLEYKTSPSLSLISNLSAFSVSSPHPYRHCPTDIIIVQALITFCLK